MPSPSIIIKIQDLAGESLDTIIECLTPDERLEALSIYTLENDEPCTDITQAVDFILNAL